MEITERDLELFRKLAKYGMLSTKQVGDLLFNSIASTTVLRRLRLLETGLYVDRVQGLESQEVLWVLTKKGASMVNLDVPKRRWSKNMLPHDYKLLSLRLALEGIGIVDQWKPEHLMRSQIYRKYGFRNAKEKLIPDGLMTVEVEGKMETVAVELELHLKSFGRLKKIMRRYHEKNGVYAVWYVAPSKGVLNQALRAWEATRSSYSLIKFYGSYLEEVMKDPLKARLRNVRENVAIGSLWRRKGTYSADPLPAQGVSGQGEKKERENLILNADDHTPILEGVS